MNQLAVDRYGDFIASCADDGKVVIRSLYDTEPGQELQFDRPVKVRRGEGGGGR